MRCWRQHGAVVAVSEQEIPAKTCTTCGRTYPATTEFFYKSPFSPGLKAACKCCHRAYARAWAETHPEQHKATTQRWLDENAERNKQREKEYRVRPDVKERRAKNALRRYYRTSQDRLAGCMRASIHRAREAVTPRKNWQQVLGYSIAELKSHLESLFEPGMSWDNYGRNGWHIDHVRPVSSFTFTSPDDPDFKVCWALSNLQPLWEHANCSKGASFPGSERGESVASS